MAWKKEGYISVLWQVCGKQDIYCTYDVTLRCVLAAIVTLDKQCALHIPNVCL